MRLFVVAVSVFAAVAPALGHHPVSSYYDASQLVPVTGVVVEFRVANPHVVLIVDGTTPDGRSGLWAFEGLPPNALARQASKDFREKLRTGTRQLGQRRGRGGGVRCPRATWPGSVSCLRLPHIEHFREQFASIFASRFWTRKPCRCASPPIHRASAPKQALQARTRAA